MRRLLAILGMAALMGAVLCAGAHSAAAQRGGSGGGGGGRSGGRTPLVFDYAPQIGKYTPTASGSFLISTYVTTLSIDLKLSTVDLPDDTQLTITVYARDYFNSAPWPTQLAGTMTILGRKCFLNSSALWTTAPGRLPVITSVVVTAPDGTVIVSGHP